MAKTLKLLTGLKDLIPIVLAISLGMRMARNNKTFLVVGFFLTSLTAKVVEAGLEGENIYRKQCMDCHGAKGEGVKGEYEETLAGDWSLGRLTRYVSKNMPEDNPKLCVGEEAEKVAKFVYDSFYSLEAQLRNNPPRITMCRLTTRQFRESVADLFMPERKEIQAYKAAKAKSEEEFLQIAANLAKYENDELPRSLDSWLTKRTGKVFEPRVDQWWHVGPFKAETFDKAFETRFPPEIEPKIDLKKILGKEKLSWEFRPEWEDGKVHNASKGENSAHYLYREIYAPFDQKVRLSLGSNDSFILFLNEKEILKKKVQRTATPDQEKVELSLVEGKNRILMKIVNGANAWGFYFKTAISAPPEEVVSILKKPRDTWREEEVNKAIDWYKVIDRKWIKLDETFKDKKSKQTDQGLKGYYFVSKGMNKKDGLKKTQVDESIDFDFGANPPAEGINPEQFSIAWEGSIRTRETGYYEFRLTTPNGARLYLNVNLKEGDKNYRDDASKESQHPLIDAWVSSGNKTRQETARVFLLGGRQYPLRLDFFKYKEKTGAVRFEWLPPNGTWEVPSTEDFSPHMPTRLFVTKTSFPADDRSLGYERGSSVSEEWLAATTRAALEVAEQVELNLGNLSGIKKSIASQKTDEMMELSSRILQRAFRRPLSNDEKERFVKQIFDKAESSEIAVKRVVLLALKSPQFLYPELMQGKSKSCLISSRLALYIWDSLPDDELLEIAQADQLSTREQVTRQVERMMRDSRTRAKILKFFHYWLDLDTEREFRKDRKKYPDFDQEKIAHLRRSLNLFIEDQVWSEKSDYRQLLLTNRLPLNDKLGKLYGTETKGGNFQQVAFKPKQRAGLITHPYLLAAFSYHNNSSPIHRGVFVTRRMLGRSLKEPPEAVSFKDDALDPNLSMREKVAFLTRDAACMGCHGTINNLGFSLEHYDAIGRWRVEENEKPINAKSEYKTKDGKTISLNGARSLARFTARNPDAQKAFIRHLFRYMVKQPPEAYGEKTIEELHLCFRKSKFNVMKLLIEMLTVASMHETKEDL